MAEIYWLLWVEARRNKRYKKNELGLRANGSDSVGGEGWLSWVGAWAVRFRVGQPAWWGRIPL